jgi:uncharacterized protein (DUF1330 family)
MTCFIISDVVPRDAEAWSAYVRLAPSTIEKYGGRYLARGGPIQTIEGNWSPRAIILVQFPDQAAVTRWYGSPEYAKALEFREKALHRNLICVEGVA